MDATTADAACACSCKQLAQTATQRATGETTAASAAALTPSFHRRDLPPECVPFSSAAGKRLFLEAVAGAFMESYFPLAEQFITQAEPAYCGLATLAMCLNALQIDPGRVWKGPWRWFSEELFDCCTPLSVARQSGISLAQFECLARCNGAAARTVRATPALTLEAFRETVRRCCAGTSEIVVLNYSRKALGQTGDGHFSPIGGYHAGDDMVLLLDVARFKYPPHWVALERAFASMQLLDASLGAPRGFVVLSENTPLDGPRAVDLDGWAAIAETACCNGGK